MRQMAETAADVVVGLVWLVLGGLLCRPPQHRRTGLLMVATGAAWFAGSLVESLVLLHRGPLAHVLLAYPGGALAGLVERLVVATAYVEGAILPVGRAPVAVLLLAAAIVGVAAWRYLRETGAVRRSRTAPLVAAALISTVLAVSAISGLAGVAVGEWLSWGYESALVVTAVMLFGDLRASGWGRAAVTGLVIDLGAGDVGSLEHRLARAVGDPSLEIAYALADGASFVDEGGRAATIPVADLSRAVTPLYDADRLVAMIVHDPAALRDRELVSGVRAAAGVAVANARLQADVRRRVAEVEASRSRLLHASDDQRERLAGELDAAVIARLDDATRLLAGDEIEIERRLAAARAQLRRLVVGLRPPGLEEFGLAHALRALAADAPVAVSLDVSPGRWAADVEATVWFVCAEALANVSKHSGATGVHIDVGAIGGRLVVEVTVDGVGGADLAGGSGLRGLSARARALGGTLTVGAGSGGTRLVAELPIGEPVARA
jgi:signal transduction histidine kinase